MNKQKIISISRRGDIPAFQTTWLMNRIREGFCHFKTPFGDKIFYVSLKPEDCAGLVFWTRNPAPLFSHIDELKDRGYHFYFHFTITGYQQPIESHTPSLLKSIDRFINLSNKIGPDSVHWRYDPIILSNITTNTFHIDNFSFIAKELKGFTRVCTFSFMQLYKKSRNNFKELTRKYGVQFDEPSLESKVKLSRTLGGIALENGMKFKSCCDNALVDAGITRGSCIGPEYLSLARPYFIGGWKKRPTRKGCACFESIDIGTYETCIFGCSYCYATRGRESALRQLENYNKEDTILIRPQKYMGMDLLTIAARCGAR